MNANAFSMESLVKGGFINIPRYLLNALFGENEEERQHAWVYLFMLTYCFYGNGCVRLNKRVYSCGAGELVITRNNALGVLRLTMYAFRKSASTLVERGLLRIFPGIRHTRFVIPFYDAITRSNFKERSKGEALPAGAGGGALAGKEDNSIYRFTTIVPEPDHNNSQSR